MTTTQTPDRTGNCFDALRLVLAAMVVYNHAYPLGGFGEEGFYTATRGQMNAGLVGVLGFFGISGYLIAGSFAKTGSILVYLRHRICRIFPAYYVCQLLIAVLFAPAIFLMLRGTLDGFPVFGADGAISYFLNNAFLDIRQKSIGGVLDGLPEAININGPLWTLFIEFNCYLAVIVAGVLGLLKKNRVHLLIITLCSFLLYAIHSALPGVSYPTLPTFIALTNYWGFPTAFFAGSTCWAYRDELDFGLRGFLAFALLAAVTLKFGGWTILAPLVMTLLILNLGYSFRLRLRNDFSYGIYIYHWPCQQVLACIPFFRGSLPVFLAASGALTFLFAVASWFLIEKPALQWARKSTPRRAA